MKPAWPRAELYWQRGQWSFHSQPTLYQCIWLRVGRNQVIDKTLGRRMIQLVPHPFRAASVWQQLDGIHSADEPTILLSENSHGVHVEFARRMPECRQLGSDTLNCLELCQHSFNPGSRVIGEIDCVHKNTVYLINTRTAAVYSNWTDLEALNHCNTTILCLMCLCISEDTKLLKRDNLKKVKLSITGNLC